ncbi:MAG: hypothetical protein ACXWHZ_03275 [Usitatibacter sp.]
MKALLFRPWILVAALVLPLHALAAYVFNTISYPGALLTDVRGITNTGRIAGYASFDGISNFSFTYAGGSFTILPAHVSQPSVLGINDAGVVVGSTVTTPKQAFIYDGVSYTFFSRPGWTNTEARAISNTGLVTGWSYEEDATLGFTASSGFIYDPVSHAFTDIPIPGSVFTIAQGINLAGQVVGSARLADGQHAFLRQPSGSITLFRIGTFPTRARGINDFGLMTGFLEDGGVETGFVADSLGFQELAVPGADLTAGEGINNAGQVSGLFYPGGSANSRGFIATPAAMPTGTTSGGAYTFAVDVVANVPIFIDPPVAVGYDYAIGKGNPRIAAVRLPIGIGDSIYRLKVDGRKFTLAGGDLFDFRAHGFHKGVTDFTVSCIETSAMLDPANPQAFPTELTFVASGRFTGTQKPLARDSSKPDKGGCKAHKGKSGEEDDGNDDDD